MIPDPGGVRPARPAEGGTIDRTALLDLLATGWGIVNPTVMELAGGMNSRTWEVRSGSSTWVAKAVPRPRARTYAAGLEVSVHVEAGGIAAGAPLPALDGRLLVPAGGVVVALLRFVAGRELAGQTPGEQRVIGMTLGRAHRILDGVTVRGAERFPWIDASAAHLSIRDGLRDAVVDALGDWRSIDPQSLSWGLVHSDPAPEAFRLDPSSGACGLIDWDLGLLAPRMYDVASAVMYLGGPANAQPFMRAYLEAGPLTPEEARRTMRPMLRLRWAVQADYFAGRAAADDRTGITDPAENEAGLDDALWGLEQYRAS